MTAGIYQIRHVASGKRYVGSACVIAYRWSEHRSQLRHRCHHSRYLQRAWYKYGADAFVFEIVEVVPNVADLIRREQYYLDTWLTWRPKNGYNISPTAGSSLGVRHTAATRARMSAARKGFPLSEERRAAMRGRKPNEAQLRGLAMGWYGSREFRMTDRRRDYYERRRGQPAHPNSLRGLEIGRGIPLTPERRAALVEAAARAHRGVPLSAETRAKIGAAHRGREYSEAQLRGLREKHEARRGGHHSEETRAKMRAAWERRKQRPVSEKQRAAWERMRAITLNDAQRAGLAKSWNRGPDVATPKQIATSRANLASTPTHRKAARSILAARPVQAPLFGPSE